MSLYARHVHKKAHPHYPGSVIAPPIGRKRSTNRKKEFRNSKKLKLKKEIKTVQNQQSTPRLIHPK
ncbi:hypothetical protein AG1IA_09655 [Rhizoctonia solani AG-1 IA]|uniref:Uncharacterized protein n=1 Tax=Thanatephorus cucumeris (strain AG1-IA) TaxID=983506 RepID=L8WIZ5_THACA|nr:hypothetical protein AG1IA_09655 [Rhizoctonia solani AG-1 IA]